jgi:hypothetical protein
VVVDTVLAKFLLPTARTIFAFLGFSALVTEVATLVARGRFDAGNFFSFFTVEANTLAVIVLMMSSFALTAQRTSRALDYARGAVTLYMTTTILIFIVLLSGYSSAELTAVPWDNTVLHYIMPIVVIVDWVIAAPAVAITIRAALAWLAFPLAYLVYSLVRGAIAGWYPYPFMNPSTSGYLGLVITAVIIAVILAAITWAITTVSRWPVPGVLRSPADVGVAR